MKGGVFGSGKKNGKKGQQTVFLHNYNNNNIFNGKDNGVVSN